MSGPVRYIAIRYFRSLCDDTGICRHAVRDTADSAYGYCIDDNIRALLATYSLAVEGAEGDAALLADRFVAFIQPAWTPEEQHFRAFMSYIRDWLDQRSPEPINRSKSRSHSHSAAASLGRMASQHA